MIYLGLLFWLSVIIFLVVRYKDCGAKFIISLLIFSLYFIAFLSATIANLYQTGVLFVGGTIPAWVRFLFEKTEFVYIAAEVGVLLFLFNFVYDGLCHRKK